MNESSYLQDHRRWRRKGYGRRFDFFATDGDIQSWLDQGLLAAHRPYWLCGPSFGEDRDKAADAGFIISPQGFSLHREQHPSDWEFWLFSEKLTPPGEIRNRLKQIDGIGGANGLVLLQHGQYLRGKKDVSSICVVDKVVNIDTQEVRQFEDYLRIYNALKRTVKADLAYSSKHIFPEGQIVEDERLLMTEKVAAAIRDGILYVNEIGLPLKRRF